MDSEQNTKRPYKPLNEKEIDDVLLSNIEILSEIIMAQKQKKNRNYINFHMMDLIYQFEQNIFKIAANKNVGALTSQTNNQFLETLKKLSQRKKLQKKE